MEEEDLVKRDIFNDFFESHKDGTLDFLGENNLDVDLRDGPELNIIEFMESPLGLNLTPRPFQKFILKCLYGLELDDHIEEEPPGTPIAKTKQLRFINPISHFEEGPFTEKQFLEKLVREKRCNAVEGKIYKRLILVIGRRGGKSFMSTVVCAYELYRLLRKGSPQEHYGLKRSATIQIIVVGTDKEQSQYLFDDISQYASQSPYLRKYLAGDLKKSISFITPDDLDNLREGQKIKPTLKIKPIACNPSAIRGGSAIQGVMDEVAFMGSDKTNSSAEKIYKALKPTVSTFYDGKLVLISSPNGVNNWFHSVYDNSLVERENSTFLCIQAPTWEVNPGRVSDEDFLEDYNLSKNTFYQEWGAQFEASVSSYIENFKIFENNVYPIPSDIEKDYGTLEPRYLVNTPDNPSTNYYVSIDQAFKIDSTVVSVGHYDYEEEKVIVDFVKRYTPGDKDYTSLETGYLSSKFLARDFKTCLSNFKVLKGIFDQHESATFQEYLLSEGLDYFFPLEVTQKVSSSAYKLFSELYLGGRLEIPGLPWLMQEFKNLEEKKRGNYIKVEGGNSFHDDGPDSIVRLVYLIYNECVNETAVVGNSIRSKRGEVSQNGNYVIRSAGQGAKIHKEMTRNNRRSHGNINYNRYNRRH